MPGILEAAGATIQPSAAAPLHTNEFFTGLWTNGSPLGPGAVPFLYSKFYGATRYDRLIDGNDCEISPRLTLIRRPGHSVYNSSLFPPINRFYEFRGFTVNDETIHLIADCDAPTNQITNGQFTGGSSAGWILQTGWSVGSGAPFGPPPGYLAIFDGPGTAAVSNTTHIACTAGQDMYASCWALGEPGATGSAVLRITFFNGSGVQIGFSYGSVPVPNNYIWTNATLAEPAPAGAAYAIIDFAVTGSTNPIPGPRWAATDFYAHVGLTGSPSVREVTQPTTNTVLWNKDPAASRTGFVSDGNVLYAGDGMNTHKWVTSGQAWTANTQLLPGQFIVDSNNNIQMAVGSVTANIVHILVEDHGGTGRKVTLFFSSATPFDVPNNIRITTSGLTTVPAANETTPYVLQVSSILQSSWVEPSTTIPITAYSSETGQATTGTGVSGGSAPVWNSTPGQVTQDGGNQWVNMGSAIQPWGAPGPTDAPIVTQTPLPVVYDPWVHSTWYAPSFVIQDSNGNLQQLTTAGTTGAAHPTWAATVGATTPEAAPGTAIWTCISVSAWIANHSYAVGATIQANYNYSTTSTYFDHSTKQWVTVTSSYNVTSIFEVVQAGISQTPGPPAWTNGLGTRVIDGGVIWVNNGNNTSGTHIWPGAAQTLSLNVSVLDSNNSIQVVQNFGESGATPPTAWGTSVGDSTTDNNLLWQNGGSYGAVATEAWQWAYSGKNSITNEISNASPVSQPLVVSLGMQPVIQGQGLPNPLWDTIVLWRTAAGGSTLMYDDEFPNPGPDATWIYTDTNVDPGNVGSGGQGMLNEFITAPINNENDPPPSNFIPQCYYLTRIWGYCNNVLRWTGGPDTVTGSGNATMPPVNQFTLPSKGVVCWPTSVGLICFTTTDIWAVLGQGTDASPFYVVNFQQGIGMLSADAFGVNGSTAYAMLTSHQLVSIDPGAGELEVGFPIADIFDNTMDPSLVYVDWHQGRSADTALYVANGAQYWYRMAAVSAPESGNVWSPAAVIRAPGQVRAIISAEITPGNKVLVLGPNIDGHPILKRDFSVHADAGVPYPAHATIAPIVLSQPGSTAGVQFVTTEEKMIDGASAIVVKMLFDEIHDFIHVHDADWRTLRNITNDPPNLPKQKSFLTQRLWANQDPSTVIKCRFYSQDVGWPAEDFANELFTNTVFGRLPEKARK